MKNGEMSLENRDRFIELGIKIGALRRLRGMSQEQLAERAGISRGFLAVIEAPNMIQSFSIEILFNIADALGVRAGDLLNNSIFTEEWK